MGPMLRVRAPKVGFLPHMCECAIPLRTKRGSKIVRKSRTTRSLSWKPASRPLIANKNAYAFTTFPPIGDPAGKGPDSGISLFAIRVQKEGPDMSQRLVRGLREILRKSWTTAHRHSGRPSSRPIIANKNASSLSNFSRSDIAIQRAQMMGYSYARFGYRKRWPLIPNDRSMIYGRS